MHLLNPVSQKIPSGGNGHIDCSAMMQALVMRGTLIA
eukprot:COSAG05_NODE_541_length_8832_cov_190.458491_9_plen_37_part_00